MVHGQIPVTLNYENPDPKCPVNVIHSRPAPNPKNTALVLNHALTGQSVAVVIAGPQ